MIRGVLIFDKFDSGPMGLYLGGSKSYMTGHC